MERRPKTGACEPGGGSGPTRWVGSEPGQAGNGAALRAWIQARGARALRRARIFHSPSPGIRGRPVEGRGAPLRMASMSYLVLARKYRPKTFGEVAGQESVTRTLRGAIEEERIGHAYLFTGPRGTGKTTSARLFAKALNCETGPTAEPCGTCERCVSLDTGGEVDIIEIDAASNTGVDHVRDLRDQAGYVPLQARYKIFIVDEVHMLSKAAFNALLKTLEEPPAHVKFLFATTELNKVPDTILSRCQVLRLSPLPEATIVSRLDEVFAAEGVQAEEGVTGELARRARGGMRDALSLADQLLALVGTQPRLEDCERLAAEGSSTVIEALVERMVAADPEGAYAALPTVEGNEQELLGGILVHLRACLAVALCGSNAPVVPGGPYDEAHLAALAARASALGARRLELWLQELVAARERMRLLPAQARLVLELVVLELCRPENTMPLDELVRRLEALEGRADSGGARTPSPSPAPQASPATQPPRATQVPREPAPAASSTPSPDASLRGEAHGTEDPSAERPASMTSPRVRTNSVADAWKGFLEELSSKSSSLGDVLTRRGFLERLTEGEAVVKLKGLSEQDRELMSSPRNQRVCSKAFSAALGRQINVIIEDAAAQKPGKDDPFTSRVVEMYEGRLEE